MRFTVKDRLPDDWMVSGTPFSAGFDLRACMIGREEETVLLRPGYRCSVPTGTIIDLDTGEVGLVCPRSGLAIKYGVTVLNAPGVIDPDYRQEVMVILHNMGKDRFEIKHGDRIAQLIVLPCTMPVAILGSKPVKEVREDGLGSAGK